MPGYRTGYRIGHWLASNTPWSLFAIAGGVIAGFLFSEFVL